jgi:L-alanine-DL-glutamate epimerase-like enolase superfamily enzyme
VTDGFVDVPTRPGMGVDLTPEAAAYLAEEDRAFFD